MRRGRLESCARMPSPTSSTVSLTDSASRSSARHGHLEVVEHVVVGLPRGLQLPVLARGERVERQLDVVFQLLGGLRAGGLVVDQLVLARPSADRRDGRRGRRGRAGGGARAGRRTGARTTPARSPARAAARGSASAPRGPSRSSSTLALAVAEAAPAPAGVEQLEHLRERLCRRRSGSARAPGGRRSRSAGGASARSGCAGRARTCTAADSCGRSRCPRPTAPGRSPCAAGTAPARRFARRDRLARARSSRPRGPPSRTAQQRLVERRGLEDLALQRRGGGEQADVDVGQRLRQALPLGALQQGGELQQLQVAHHPVGDVQVGVQPQLAEPPADPRDAREHLLAHQLRASASSRPRSASGVLRGHAASAPSGRRSLGARASPTIAATMQGRARACWSAAPGARTRPPARAAARGSPAARRRPRARAADARARPGARSGAR